MAHFLFFCTWDFDDLYQTIRLWLPPQSYHSTLQPVQAGPGKLALCIGHNHIIILAFVIFTLTGHWVVATQTQCHRSATELAWLPKFVPCTYSLVLSLLEY